MIVEQKDATVAPGLVIEQDPYAGSNVTGEETVTLTVSALPDQAYLSDFRATDGQYRSGVASMKGVPYTHGVLQSQGSGYNPQKTTFTLSRHYVRLKGVVGLDDAFTGGASVQVEIFDQDNTSLFKKTVKVGQPVTIDIPITSVIQLTLEATDLLSNVRTADHRYKGVQGGMDHESMRIVTSQRPRRRVARRLQDQTSHGYVPAGREFRGRGRAETMLRVRHRAVALVTAALMVAGLVSRAGTASAVTPVASPRISVGPDVVVGESVGIVDVPVTLSAPGLSTVTVNFTTINGTAIAPNSGTDYTGTSGTLTFTPGQTRKDVLVAVTNDSVAEFPGLESFFVSVSAPTNATIARAVAMVSIIDNDTVVATPKLFMRDAIVDEKAGTAGALPSHPRRRTRHPIYLIGTVTVQLHETSTAPGKPPKATLHAKSGNLSHLHPMRRSRRTSPSRSDDTALELSNVESAVTLTAPTGATIGAAVGTVVSRPEATREIGCATHADLLRVARPGRPTSRSASRAMRLRPRSQRRARTSSP